MLFIDKCISHSIHLLLVARLHFFVSSWTLKLFCLFAAFRRNWPHIFLQPRACVDSSCGRGAMALSGGFFVFCFFFSFFAFFTAQHKVVRPVKRLLNWNHRLGQGQDRGIATAGNEERGIIKCRFSVIRGFIFVTLRRGANFAANAVEQFLRLTLGPVPHTHTHNYAVPVVVAVAVVAIVAVALEWHHKSAWSKREKERRSYVATFPVHFA